MVNGNKQPNAYICKEQFAVVNGMEMRILFVS